MGRGLALFSGVAGKKCLSLFSVFGVWLVPSAEILSLADELGA